MHSTISPDSRATMPQMGQAALRQGIREIAFTEHFDFHPDERFLGYYKPDKYFENIEAARREMAPQGLTIRAGIELGEPHLFAAQQGPVLEQYPYDVVLGSLHWLGEHSMFDVNYFRKREMHDAITPYFEEMERMIRAGGFDILAHMDVFKRAAFRVYGEYNPAEFEEAIRAVLQACIETGTGIEINTAGLRLNVQQAHPPLMVLRWYKEMGGERLTIGSDAHRPEHVGAGFGTALEMARLAGFEQLAIYQGRQVARWAPIPQLATS